MALLAKAALEADQLDKYPWGSEIAVLEAPTAQLLAKMWALGYTDKVDTELDDAAFDVVNDRAVTWAREHAGELLTDVEATTQERIGRLVAETLADPDATEADLAKAILAEFDGMTEYRASMIARTETADAAGKGSAAGWSDSGFEAVLISDGDDFDEACQEADGQIWSLDHYEANVLEHPNCSRSASPLAAGSYDPADVVTA